MDTLVIEYAFGLGTDEEKSYRVELDPETFALRPPPVAKIPDWAELDNCRCKGCPLAETGTKYCPVATNLSVIAQDFRDEISHRETTVEVTTPDRTYKKVVPIQQGLFSLMGLIMGTSDCPSMKFLRPMARFHLPFANALETSVRSVSMYLLRRYVESRRGGNPTFALEELLESYDGVNRVNHGIAGRLRSLGSGDAGANAITILHRLGGMLTFSISRDLSEIEALFAGHE